MIAIELNGLLHRNIQGKRIASTHASRCTDAKSLADISCREHSEGYPDTRVPKLAKNDNGRPIPSDGMVIRSFAPGEQIILTYRNPLCWKPIAPTFQVSPRETARTSMQEKTESGCLHRARSKIILKISARAIKKFNSDFFCSGAFPQIEVRASMPTSSIFLYCTMKCSTAPAPLGRVRKETS
jgi:hypothetical protein